MVERQGNDAVVASLPINIPITKSTLATPKRIQTEKNCSLPNNSVFTLRQKKAVSKIHLKQLLYTRSISIRYETAL